MDIIKEDDFDNNFSTPLEFFFAPHQAVCQNVPHIYIYILCVDLCEYMRIEI